MTTEDTELATRIQQGDRGAFEMVVARYEAPVYNLARRMVSDCDDAADITQNVFVKAYLHIDSFQVDRSLFSWIYRIAVNESLNFLEGRARRQAFRYEPPAAQKTPEEDIGLRENSELIQRALEQMTVDQRIVIVLKHLLLLPYCEIATILGLTEKTVKSRLFTARQALKDHLVDFGYAP